MDPLKTPDAAADPVVSAEISTDPRITPNLNHLNPLRGYLGVEHMDPKTSQMLDYIYKELSGDKGLSDGDILMAAKEIKFRVGFPRLGETMTSKIYNYLRAAETVKEAEKRRDALLA